MSGRIPVKRGREGWTRIPVNCESGDATESGAALKGIRDIPEP
jgi:hypothetical protein